MNLATEAKDLLSSAKNFQQRGRFAEAEAVYRKLLVLDPDHAEALNNLGNTLRAQGRANEAAECLERALGLRPDNPIILTNLALVLGDLDRFEDAVELHKKAVDRDPTFAPGFNNLGLALKELGRLAEAEASYIRALELRAEFPEALNNLGNVLRAQERAEEAIAQYRRSIELRPTFADAHYNLARALQDKGDLAAAEEGYRKAVSLATNLAGAHANLGNMLLSQGKLAEALQHLARVVALKPHDAQAHNNLGAALYSAERIAEAVASLRQAVALEPELAGAWSNLADALRDQGRLDEALEASHLALDLDPSSAIAWSGLSALHQELGNLLEARKCIDKALGIDPSLIWAHVARIHLATSGLDPDYLRQVEDLGRKQPAASAKRRSGLHFALGEAYERLGMYAEAFHHMAEGARIRRAALSYDEKGVVEHFARPTRIFTRSMLEARSGCGFESDLPVFIVGSPRSGTTLTEQILAGHPEVHGAGELTFLSDLFPDLAVREPIPLGYPESVPHLAADRLYAAGKAYASRLAALAPGARRITDKMPGNFGLLGLIRLILPRAKVIHVQRNPVDVCLSCFATDFRLGHSHTNELGELGRYHRRYLELMKHWRRVLPADAMLELRYEDLVNDLETQVRRILDFCDLSWDEHCLSFHEVKRRVSTASVVQVRQPLYKSSVERWRRYERHLGPLLQALGPAVEEYQRGAVLTGEPSAGS